VPASALEWQLQCARKTAAKKKSVDLGFVIDITASMQFLLDTVAAKVEEIVHEVKSQLGDYATIQIGIVGYRDIGDHEPIKTMPFTTNLAEVQRFLRRLEAAGGGDISEDVIAGIQAAMTLKWSSATKIMFLLAQSPCHGIRFHEKFEPCSTLEEIHEAVMDCAGIADTEKESAKEHCLHQMFDVYSDDPKQWQMADKIMRELQEKRIRVVGLQCGQQGKTDHMYNTFREQYMADPQAEWSLDVYPINADKNYFAKMVKTISVESFCKRTANRASVSLAAPQPLLSLPEAVATSNVTGILNPDWSRREDWVRVSGDVLSSVVRTKKDLQMTPKRHCEGDRVFLVCPHPFAEGAMRYAFHAFDEKNECKLVAKVYKDVKMQEAHWWYGGEMDTQACARFIAEEFSKLYPENPVSFVQAQLFRNSENEPFPFMAIEPWLDGDYQKLTSNAGYMAKNSQLAQALSHFSYQFSEGALMLTDHQGVKDNLTDPQIHCDEQRFGPGNLSSEGMDIFWSLHTCSDICREVGCQPHPHQHNCGESVLEQLSSKQPAAGEFRTKPQRQLSLRERFCSEVQAEAAAKLAAETGDLGLSVVLAGATFRWEEGLFTATEVSGWAKKAGLGVGHYVCKIGGKPVANLTTRQCVELLAKEDSILEVHLTKSKLQQVAHSRSSPTSSLAEQLKGTLEGLSHHLLKALSEGLGVPTELCRSIFLHELQLDAAKALRDSSASSENETEEDVVGGASGSDPDEEVLAGATWAWRGRQPFPRVVEVAPGSAAALGEIQVGTLMLEIDGQNLSGLSRREVLLLLKDVSKLGLGVDQKTATAAAAATTALDSWLQHILPSKGTPAMGDPSRSSVSFARRSSSPRRSSGPVHFDISTADTSTSQPAASPGAKSAVPSKVDACPMRDSSTKQRHRHARHRACSKGARATEQTCFGRCGKTVKVSNLKFMADKMRAFCSDCQQKRVASGFPSCSAPKCREAAQFSCFEYNIENSKPLCAKCDPGSDWDFVPSVPSSSFLAGA